MKIMICPTRLNAWRPKIVNKTKAQKWRNRVESYAGNWVNVDTTRLFPREFAVVCEDDLDIRIPTEIVVDIQDDARPSAAHCSGCKTWFLNVPDSAIGTSAGCPACEVGELQRMSAIIEGAYGIPLATQRAA